MPRQRGRRGAGSIVRRGGKYRALWSTTEGGKRVRRSATFTLRGDAEWWLREAQRSGSTPDTGQTVAEYLERWLERKRKIAPATRLQYENHVRVHITPVIGTIVVARLQRRHVEAFVEDRRRHVSPATGRPLTAATVGKILTTLRSALEDGVPAELPDNVAAKVEAPAVERKLIRAVGAGDAQRILEAVSGTWVEPIARFLFGSALRISEALSINQGDIDWDAGVVRIRESKTVIRRLPVDDDALDALRMALAAAPRRGKSEPVFFSPRPNRDGVRDRLSRHSVSHALPRMMEGASLERLTAHGLRHAWATVGLEAGLPIEAIAEQLGHRSLNMTRRYAHVTPALRREALSTVREAVRRRQAPA